MIPATATAVVTFVLLVIPGIVFELLWQRTRPRRDESAFVEVSRVLLTGVVFSGTAAAVVGIMAAVVPGAAVNILALVGNGQEYMARFPGLALGSLVTVVLLAICWAVATHDLLTPAALRRIAQESVWHTAFGRMAPAGVRVFLSVQLKDGTTLTGYSAGYSTEPDPTKRDLLLAAPLAIRPAGQTESRRLAEAWQTLVVCGADITTIAAAYVGGARPATPIGWRRRALAWLSRHGWQSALGGGLAVLALHLTIALVIR